MSNTIITGLVYNVALLLILSIIYNMFLMQLHKKAKWKGVLEGVIIGFISVILMLTPVKLVPGVIFDTRSILISVTAMFFGFIPTIIATAIVCVFRVIIGGAGTLMGVLVTISSAAIGLLGYHFRLKKIITADFSANIQKRSIYLAFYLEGVIVHVAMLLCMLALPHDIRRSVFSSMWLPILLIYPVGFLLLASLLFNELKHSQTRLALIASESQYKALNYENEKKQTLLRALIDSIPDMIFYKDMDSVYMGCNTAFEKFAGKEQAALIGCTDRELFDSETAELFLAMDTEMLKQGKPRRNDENVTYPDGAKVYVETLKTPYFDTAGKALGLIGISRDITERKKREEEVRYLTYHDRLTGLYNKTFFDEAILRLDQPAQLPISVIIGDVNGLKLINDAFGQNVGDKLLTDVAKILLTCTRPEDIVARIGGDGFGVLLPKTDSRTAQSIVKRIQNACENDLNGAIKELNSISIALGYEIKENPEEPFDSVRNSAEEFMYKRKLLERRSPHSAILSSIRTTMQEKSHETQDHTERLAGLSKKLGAALDLNEREMVELELLSALHDIGKIGIDERILTKAGPLTEEEWKEMKKHPEIGCRIAMATQEFRSIAEYILCHHERWDGKGYPQGLAGKDIPILSRILSIVDSYDAMVNDRVYRKAISTEDAVAEILQNAGTQFDPLFTKVFVEKVLGF